MNMHISYEYAYEYFMHYSVHRSLLAALSSRELLTQIHVGTQLFSEIMSRRRALFDFIFCQTLHSDRGPLCHHCTTLTFLNSISS